LYRIPSNAVMAGLVPAIHALLKRKAWMPGIKPGMTNESLDGQEAKKSRDGSC
jgi:hypothetical protein